MKYFKTLSCILLIHTHTTFNMLRRTQMTRTLPTAHETEAMLTRYLQRFGPSPKTSEKLLQQAKKVTQKATSKAQAVKSKTANRTYQFIDTYFPTQHIPKQTNFARLTKTDIYGIQFREAIHNHNPNLFYQALKKASTELSQEAIKDIITSEIKDMIKSTTAKGFAKGSIKYGIQKGISIGLIEELPNYIKEAGAENNRPFMKQLSTILEEFNRAKMIPQKIIRNIFLDAIKSYDTLTIDMLAESQVLTKRILTEGAQLALQDNNTMLFDKLSQTLQLIQTTKKEPIEAIKNAESFTSSQHSKKETDPWEEVLRKTHEQHKERVVVKDFTTTESKEPQSLLPQQENTTQALPPKAKITTKHKDQLKAPDKQQLQNREHANNDTNPGIIDNTKADNQYKTTLPSERDDWQTWEETVVEPDEKISDSTAEGSHKWQKPKIPKTEHLQKIGEATGQRTWKKQIAPKTKQPEKTRSAWETPFDEEEQDTDKWTEEHPLMNMTTQDNEKLQQALLQPAPESNNTAETSSAKKDGNIDFKLQIANRAIGKYENDRFFKGFKEWHYKNNANKLSVETQKLISNLHNNTLDLNQEEKAKHRERVKEEFKTQQERWRFNRNQELTNDLKAINNHLNQSYE